MRSSDGDAFKARDAYAAEPLAEAYDERRFSSLRGRLGDWLDKRALMGVAKDLPRGSLLLDIPCGTGRMTKYLSAQGFRVIGSDISSAMIAVASAGAPPSQSVVGYFQADSLSLPLDSGSVDCIVSVRFMGHVPPNLRLPLLREYARVSRKYVIADFCLSNWVADRRREVERRLRRLDLGFGEEWDWHVMARERLEADFREAGLRPVIWNAKLPLLSDAWMVLLETVSD